MNADPKAIHADRKTLAVFVDASRSGQKRAAHAAAIAQRWGAGVVGVHVVGADVMPLPLDGSVSVATAAAQSIRLAIRSRRDIAGPRAAAPPTTSS